MSDETHEVHRNFFDRTIERHFVFIPTAPDLQKRICEDINNGVIVPIIGYAEKSLLTCPCCKNSFNPNHMELRQEEMIAYLELDLLEDKDFNVLAKALQTDYILWDFVRNEIILCKPHS